MNIAEISVIVTSYNEEENLKRCLRNLKGFGEILLVDSFSTDGTVAIARAYGVTVYSRPYESAARQKNWALDRVRHPWVLILDADEEVTEDLRREIVDLQPSGIDGYWIRRDSEYLGRRIRHCGWQRDKVLRLLRANSGRYVERAVHEEIALEGRAGSLENRLLHFPYSRVEKHLSKIEEYSTRGACDYVTRSGRFAVLNMLVHPPFRFLRMYVLQGGLLDGSSGFILCLLSSYGVFLKYAKAWEQQCQRTD